jgi:hypothetical protein
MEQRRLHVLTQLSDGDKSIKEMFEDTPWTYAQSIITLRKMLHDGEIVQIGKEGREVIFSLPSERHQLAPVGISKIVEHLQVGDNQINVVGMKFIEDDGFIVDLRFSDGEVVSAHLVA